MRPWIAVALAAVIVIAGCGSAAQRDGPTVTPAPVPTAETTPPTEGVLVTNRRSMAYEVIVTTFHAPAEAVVITFGNGTTVRVNVSWYRPFAERRVAPNAIESIEPIGVKTARDRLVVEPESGLASGLPGTARSAALIAVGVVSSSTFELVTIARCEPPNARLQGLTVQIREAGIRWRATCVRA